MQQTTQALQMKVAVKTGFLLSSWRNRLDGPLGQVKQTPSHGTQIARHCDGALSETQQVLAHGIHSFSTCKGTEY